MVVVAQLYTTSSWGGAAPPRLPFPALSELGIPYFHMILYGVLLAMRSLGGGGPPADRGIETTLWGPQVQAVRPA